MSYVLSGQPNNGRPFSDYGKRPKISIYRVPIIPNDRLGIILRPICVMAQSIFPLCLIWLAVERLYSKSRASPDEASLFFGGRFLCSGSLCVRQPVLSEEEKFFANHRPHRFVEVFV